MLSSKSSDTPLAQHVFSRGKNLTETRPASCPAVVKINLCQALLHTREPPQRFHMLMDALKAELNPASSIKQFFRPTLNVLFHSCTRARFNS